MDRSNVIKEKRRKISECQDIIVNWLRLLDRKIIGTEKAMAIGTNIGISFAYETQKAAIKITVEQCKAQLDKLKERL